MAGRPATTTYYRLAIAGGKNMNFPQPAAGNGIGADFGTDGGVHNFLRYIEDWGGRFDFELSRITGELVLLAVCNRHIQVLHPGVQSAKP